jgi:hypothetical protein
MAPQSTNPHRLGGAGLSVLLEEVIRIGRQQLTTKEWETICAAAVGKDSSGSTATPRENNAIRVRLFRARRKLAQLTGWKNSPTT